MELVFVGLMVVALASIVGNIILTRTFSRQHAQDPATEQITQMRMLSEAAFAHLVARSAQDAAQASTTQRTAVFQMQQEAEDNALARNQVLDPLTETLNDSLPGTIVTKTASGQTRIFEPLVPGDPL